MRSENGEALGVLVGPLLPKGVAFMRSENGEALGVLVDPFLPSQSDGVLPASDRGPSRRRVRLADEPSFGAGFFACQLLSFG
jgi:hypothetical protein